MFVTSGEMYDLEGKVFATGISAESLMNEAGRRVADEIIRRFAHRSSGYAIGFIGKGNKALREALNGTADLLPDSQSGSKNASEAADASARSAALLKALLCAGLYPNVLVAPRDVRLLGEKASEAEPSFTPSSKSKTAGECAFTRCDPDVERCIKERQESGRRPRFDDGPEDAAYLHPCCLCFDATALDHRYVVYREIVRTAKVYVRDATTVAPLALILFGGRLTVHHERGIISVDEKVHFRAPPKVATLASILRSELEALLLRKIVTPDAQVDERERAFVDASRAVIGAEALGDAQKRHTNKGAAFQPKSRPKPKRKEKPVVVSTDQDHDESATHGDAQAYQKPAGFKVLRGDAAAYEPTSNGGGARVPRSRGRGRS